MKIIAILISTFIITACSGSQSSEERYLSLGPIVLEANRYYEAELEKHPTAAINGESYMSVLKIKSTRAFYRLEPYRVEVRPWTLGPKSGFSVALFDGQQSVLYDCSDTPTIDSWRYSAPVDPHVLIIEPPCGWPVEFIDE